MGAEPRPALTLLSQWLTQENSFWHTLQKCGHASPLQAARSRPSTLFLFSADASTSQQWTEPGHSNVESQRAEASFDQLRLT